MNSTGEMQCPRPQMEDRVWPARSWLKTWALGGGGARKVLENEKVVLEKKNVGKMWCSKSKNWCLGLVFDNPFCGVKNAFLWC